MKWKIQYTYFLVLLSIIYKYALCNCVIDCFRLIDNDADDEDIGSSFNASMSSITEITNRQTSKLVAATAATENLTQFCNSVYQPAARCLRSCPGGDPFKSMTLKTLAVTDFVCSRKLDELNPLWPCIKRVTDGMNNLCRSRCRRWEADMTDILSQAKRLSSDLEDQSKARILGIACTYAQCKSDCESPTLESRCGEPARRLVQEMLLVSILNVEEMLETSQTTFTSIWPQHCEKLKIALTSSTESVHSIIKWYYLALVQMSMIALVMVL